MSPDADTLRRKQLVAAAVRAIAHANGLASTFTIMTSQLTACLTDLTVVLELATPGEKAVLAEALSGKFAGLEPVIERLQTLADLARRPVATGTVQ